MNVLQSIRNSVSRLWGEPKKSGQPATTELPAAGPLAAKMQPPEVSPVGAAAADEAVVVGFVDAPRAAYAVTVTGSFVQFSKEALDEEMKKRRPMNS